MCCNNYNRGQCGGIFQNYQAFWIVVVVAIVVIWVHYAGCGCNNYICCEHDRGCGCNPCCDPCCNPCCNPCC